MKFSGDKPRWCLLPFDVLQLVVRVMEAGLYEGTEKEREPNDWQKGAPWLEYWDAMMRHMVAWKEGEDFDHDTGYNHIAHAIACGLILLWYGIYGVGTDDRKRHRENK